MDTTRQNVNQPLAPALGILAALLLAHPATAQTYTNKTVKATDSIEASGGNGLPNGATVPTAYAVPSSGTLKFTSVTGSISFNIGSGSNFNDADGVGSVSDTNISAADGISGIVHTSKAAYLVGLFTDVTLPNSAPAGLTFSDPGSGTGINTNFSTLSPLLGQTFFIGDGLTGDGTGAAQTFVIPNGAAKLYLGFADAADYHGQPGSYGDNSGSLTVSFFAAPEPSACVVWGIGALGLGALGVRARRQAGLGGRPLG